MRRLTFLLLLVVVAGCTATAAPHPDATPAPASPAGTPVACSAAELPDVTSRSDLPAAAADTLHEIGIAASACDYTRLGELAHDSPMFLGADHTSPDGYADHWRQQEQDGIPVTAVLVRLAGAPTASHTAQMPGDGDPASRQVELLIAPAAFNDFDSDTNRAQIRELFADLLGDTYVDQSFSDGAYLGWRIGVTADGHWVTFTDGT